MGEYDAGTRLVIDRRRKEDRERRIRRLKGEDQYLALELTGNPGVRGAHISQAAAGFYGWRPGVEGGMTPSGWFRGRGLTEAFVPKEYRESFLYMVDKLNRFPFSWGWNRRTVRTADYGPSARQAFSLLTAYENLGFCGVPVEDYILRRMDEETLDYIGHSWNFNNGFSYIYAAEIDRGNDKVIDALKELILSESNTAYLDRMMILGIIRSDNEELHGLLGDLLLAARLQEGLRQSICESMDQGTKEAFLTLLKVIEDHDLIRYSSVKRAVSTWIGIFDENYVDRGSAKLLDLMGRCLRDRSVCMEQFTTNDSVAISVGLWALGFEEADRAVEVMSRLVDCGTKNQRLTCAYYNQTLFDDSIRMRTAKKAILEYGDDLELAAAFLPAFSYPLGGWVREIVKKMEKPDKTEGTGQRVTDYYRDRKEALALYERFQEIYGKLPKKGLVFNPCIFPWYRVELSKAQIIEQLGFLAFILGDEEKITWAAALLGEMSGHYGRGDYLTLLLGRPANRTQKELLIGYMGLSQENASSRAIALVKKLPLEREDYRIMEDMLRFKRSELRRELLGFLMGQDDEGIGECLKRLLGDKREEKRSAGLDILLRLSKDKKRAVLYERVKLLALSLKDPTDKEKVLLKEILGEKRVDAADDMGFGLYDYNGAEALRTVKVRGDAIGRCVALPEKVIIEKIKKLDRLIHEYRDVEYLSASGERELVGNSFWRLKDKPSESKLAHYPLEKELRAFYEEEIGDYGVFVQMEARMLLGNSQSYENGGRFYRAVMGKMPFKPEPLTVEYPKQLNEIRGIYRMEFMDRKLLLEAGIETVVALTPLLNRKNMMISYQYKDWRGNMADTETCIVSLRFFDRFFEGLRYWDTDEEFERAFFGAWGLELKCREDRERAQFTSGGRNPMYQWGASNMTAMVPYWFLKAYHMGLVERDVLYKGVLNYFHRGSVLQAICQMVKGEYKRLGNRQSWNQFFGNEMAGQILARGEELIGPDTWCGKLVQELYDAIIPMLVDIELRRGEGETRVTWDMAEVSYIRGIPWLIRILMALGKDPLSRDAYYHWSYNVDHSRRGVLSRLLKVCYPADGDDGKMLGQALRGTDIKAERLVEVAMYAPQWIDAIQEYLGWAGLKSGCYYFMAHMNERFDDQKKAVITRYTPLSEEELQDGAFDIDWFRECYGLLGEKNFASLYKAAKYISDGQKHSRARKYADAATGKVSLETLGAEIKAKRNKDLLMSYGLVPFGPRKESDMLDRYQFIQNFAKEAKQFGAQRRASEIKAAQIALVNLSVHGGFSDVTRLTLRMESRLAWESAAYMQWQRVSDVEVCLQISGEGKSEILCRKNKKALKSVPSRLGKDPYVVELKDCHKKLKDQYVRAKRLMEESMETGAWFTAAETAGLMENLVVAALLRPLVFVSGEFMGFVDVARGGEESVSEAAGGAGETPSAGASRGADETSQGEAAGKDGEGYTVTLTSWDNTVRALTGDEKLRIAHLLDMYRAGVWHQYQQYLFEHQIRQPFKQVFRELYVKLQEELGQRYSRMFAGNQIQPQKTVGCLKGRRWAADYEEGLQKVYYKENIVARICALADWFSPSDAEEPTLEWVEFSDRRTYEALTIEKVPDLIYSEVMRDVDLAVSVAHCGGVDPETSHSTIEMRRAIVEFNLPLFGLKNVTLTDSHAVIQGSRASYTVHLGSGVVHQKGGAMLHILPVHSQRRGKLFLPFVDEDPKTAEIMSKIVLLAEDKKLKDPSILAQIM